MSQFKFQDTLDCCSHQLLGVTIKWPFTAVGWTWFYPWQYDDFIRHNVGQRFRRGIVHVHRFRKWSRGSFSRMWRKGKIPFTLLLHACVVRVRTMWPVRCCAEHNDRKGSAIYPESSSFLQVRKIESTSNLFQKLGLRVCQYNFYCFERRWPEKGGFRPDFDSQVFGNCGYIWGNKWHLGRWSRCCQDKGRWGWWKSK